MNIVAENLTKTYRNQVGQVDRTVLKDLNLSIESGSKVAIMGPSGSGKTTLLSLLGTLLRPDEGKVTMNGLILDNLSEKERNRFRNTQIGFVFQTHNLLPQCTLFENVLIPTLVGGQDPLLASARAETLLTHLNLFDQRNQKPGELSGGECQRAAVARALINEPRLVLADEPTGSLDKTNANRLMDALTDINATYGVTLIVATHAESVAARMDKVFLMEDGQLIPLK